MGKIIVALLAAILLLLPTQLSLTGFGQVKEYEGPGLLVESIAKLYKRPVDEIREIVKYAHVLENPDGFPSAIDLLAVMAVESRFDRLAVHPIGPSVGLMQINYGVHKTPNLNDPLQNITKGFQILQEYYGLAKSEARTLVYYNAGPGRGAEICKEKCSTPYVEKVKSVKRKFETFAKKERLQCFR